MAESVPTTAAELRLAVVTLALFIVVPLTVYLGGPPLWSHSLAQAECVEVVENRLGEDPASAKATWVHLPIAHWACASDGRQVADLGWWVTQSTSDSAVTARSGSRDTGHR